MLDGVTVEYEAPDGQVWVLISPDGGSRQLPVFLADADLSGWSRKPDRKYSGSITRYGERSRGWSVSPLSIEIPVVVQALDGSLSRALRAWREAWPTDVPGDYGAYAPHRPGKLWVKGHEGVFWTPVVEPEFPDFPKGVNRLKQAQETLTCRSAVGHWWGEARKYTGDFTLRAVGDRPLSPALRLRWTGADTSVTFPSGLRINLPQTGNERYINLDRGMSGQVTRPDGSVDTGAWSSLQGLVHGLSLRPGDETGWKLGPGLTLEVTPRYLSPWR